MVSVNGKGVCEEMSLGEVQWKNEKYVSVLQEFSEPLEY